MFDLAAVPPSVSQVLGKHLFFLETKFSEKNVVDSDHLVLALTRLRDFPIEREIKDVSIQVQEPNLS